MRKWGTPGFCKEKAEIGRFLYDSGSCREMGCRAQSGQL